MHLYLTGLNLTMKCLLFNWSLEEQVTHVDNYRYGTFAIFCYNSLIHWTRFSIQNAFSFNTSLF